MSAKKTSRRRFLRLIAAGGVATLAAPALAAAPGSGKSARSPKGAPEARLTEAMRAEIKNQKDYLAKALKTIREYPMPPGSEMAFAFRPMRAERRRKSRRAAPERPR